MADNAEELELIIIFGSSHDAIMGERLLLDSGLEVRVMPMPVQLGPGCGIALRIDQRDSKKARALLGGTIQGIYRRPSESGQVFEPWNP
jgi:hypothetical protein